ncbi:hypothetical protein GQ457_11G001870 [Hibiscus cannabinus]
MEGAIDWIQSFFHLPSGAFEEGHADIFEVPFSWLKCWMQDLGLHFHVRERIQEVQMQWKRNFEATWLSRNAVESLTDRYC